MTAEASPDQVPDQVRQLAAMLVAAGFEPEDEIVRYVMECGEDHGRTDLATPIRAIVRELLETHLHAQQQWTRPTDCERLDTAFRELEGRGVVARQDFTGCLTDGHAEIWDSITEAQRDGREVVGYAFYHSQDTELALESGELYLAFGSTEDAQSTRAHYWEDSSRLRKWKNMFLLMVWPGERRRYDRWRQERRDRRISVGKTVTQVMKQVGFAADWNGSPETRVRLSGLDWKRPRDPKTGGPLR